MAVSPGMNSNQINDTILASGIAKFVVPTPMASPLYEVLAMVLDNKDNHSNVVDIPAWDAFPAVAETTEGDESANVNYSTSKKSMTGVMLDTSALITDQVVMDSMLLESQMVGQMVLNLRNTIDAEVLELFKTASNVTDKSDVNLTLAFWRAGLAAFRAQKPIGTAVFVGSPNQLRDILDDMANIGPGQLGAAGQTIFSSSVIDGYRGPYAGVQIFESSNVASNDADNDIGGWTTVVSSGPGAPPTMSGLGLGIWQPIQAEGQRLPKRHGIETTVSARVGFSRMAEYLVRGLISKKAAA